MLILFFVSSTTQASVCQESPSVTSYFLNYTDI